MKEYIVILDKRNEKVLDFNGHSVDPIEYGSVFMRFDTEDEANKTLVEECQCEELNPDNYEVATIRIIKERVKMENCKFCIDTQIKYQEETPTWVENFRFDGYISIEVAYYRDRSEVKVIENSYDRGIVIEKFEPQRYYNFCPYCGKEL